MHRAKKKHALPIAPPLDALEDNLKELITPEDRNFTSELVYDGYRDIEEYDNDIYGADVENEDELDKELDINDREEEDTGEENLVDPQENRKIPP